MILEFLKSMSDAVGSVFKWSTHRSQLKNTPDVKKSEVREKEADAVAKVEKAIHKKDIDTIRKELAE